MKQVRIFLFMLFGLFVTHNALADDKPIPADQLPAAAKTFVKTHFKGQTITYAEKDATSYECRLSNGTEIDFDRKGNWGTVESNSKQAIPSSLVPQAIQQYVKAKYPKQVITKIDKERYGYEIELSNNLDLKFTKKGQFIGIDR